jgi:hypothetical protein
MNGKWQERIKGLAQKLIISDSTISAMLKAGDFFLAGNTGGVVAAFVPWGKAFAGVASAHIFHYAKTESLEIGNQQTKVARFGSGLDTAISPVFAACEPTHLGKAKAWRRRMVNDRARLGGCITDVSWSIAYVALQPGNPPEPGDSGTPVVQDGKVVGMLLSLSMHTWKEIMMNAELIKREAKL